MPAVETPPLQVRYIPGKHTCTVLLIQTFNISQCPYQSLNILKPVSDGNVSQNITDISKLDLNIIFISEKIINFNTCQPISQCINGEFCNIKIKNTGSIDQIHTICIITADLIDLLSGILRHPCNLFKGFLSLSARFLLEISRLDNRR